MNLSEQNNILVRPKKDKHLSFGSEKHRCLGAVLAQKIVVELMMNMKGNAILELNFISDKWINTFGFRALSELYVKVE